MEDRGKIKGQGTHKVQTSEDVSQQPKTDYASIIETALDAFWITDLQGRILDVNDSSCQMTGYTHEEMLAMSVSDIEALEKPEETAKHAKKTIEQGYDRFETCHRCKDGKIIQCEISAKYSSFGGGQIVVFVRDITERKRMEELLSNERDLIQTLLENQPDFIYFKNNEARFHRVSNRFCDFFGRTKEDIIGKTDLDLFPEEIAKKTYEEDMNIIKTGTPLINKEESAAGTWVLTTKMPWFNKKGDIIGLFGISRDITERKRTEEALLRSEEKYRVLFESIVVGMAVIDAETMKVVLANQAASKLYGFDSAEDLIGINPLDLIHPDDRERALRIMAEDIFKKDLREMHEIRTLTRDGREKWVSTLGARTEFGGSLAVLGSFIDISEHKWAEEALRQSGEKLRAVFESAAEGITVTDLEGNILEANEEVVRQMGYTKEEYIGRRGFEFLSPKDHTRAAEDTMRRLTEGYIGTRAYTFIKKDGTEHPAEVNASFIRDASGHPIAIVSVTRDITERRNDELKLLQSQKKFQALVETTSDFIWEMNLNGVYTYCSPQIETLWGFKPEEMLGKTPFDLLPPEDREQAIKAFSALSESSSPFINMELRSFDSTGRIKSLEISGVPFFDIAGKQCGYRGITRDITERKQAQEALRESEQRFRRLAENAPDVIIRYEFLPQRHYSFISTAITAISGYTPEEYYADPDLGFKLIHPNDMTLLRSLDRRDLTSGMPEVIRLLRKDRVFVWVEQHSIPIYDKEGNLAAVEAIIRDITRRKQAEDTLLTMATSSPIGIYTSQNGKFRYVNPWLQELLGYCEDELLGMNPLMLVFPEDVKKVRENVVKMLKGEQTTPYEFRYVTKGGEVKWALERVASINYLGKRAILGSFMDITQYKLMENDIRCKELEVATAREMDRLKNQLLSTVSHELRTPLASIKGYSTLLLDYNRRLKRGQKQESLAAIDQSADRLTELIDHLLDMSRLEAGLLKLNKIPNDISGIIKAAVYEAQLRAPAYQISSKLENSLPKVNIDGKRIRQVLDNLLDNSVKYSKEGTEIVVKAWQKDNELVVSVADQGIGITAEEFDKIFDRMYRIEQRLSQDPGGMGLGLSLCKALVEGHGGRIWLKSLVGKGSTFYLALPIETEDTARDKN